MLHRLTSSSIAAKPYTVPSGLGINSVDSCRAPPGAAAAPPAGLDIFSYDLS